MVGWQRLHAEVRPRRQGLLVHLTVWRLSVFDFGREFAGRLLLKDRREVPFTIQRVTPCAYHSGS